MKYLNDTLNNTGQSASRNCKTAHLKVDSFCEAFFFCWIRSSFQNLLNRSGPTPNSFWDTIAGPFVSLHKGHTRDEGPIEGALQVKNIFPPHRHTSGRIKGGHLSCNMSLAIHDVRRAGRLAITRMNRCANSLLCEHKHTPRQCHWKCDFHNRAGNEARGRNLARQSRGFNLQHPLEDSISHSKWVAKPLHFGFIQQENLAAMDKCDDRNKQALRNDHQCLSYNIPLFT